jgi:hypothetical protein
MKPVSHGRKESLASRAFACAGCIIILAVLALRAGAQQPDGQPGQLPYAKDPANLPKALSNLQAGNYSSNDVEIVARMGATQAVPALEEQFKGTQDPEAKLKIANALVRLKDNDDTYLDYLAARAAEAVSRDEPDPFRHDENGKVDPKQPSAEFVAWAAKRNLDAKSAFYQIVLDDVGSTIELATSQDKRAIPLLRKALSSRNAWVQQNAAVGLAVLGDKDSIALIIEACRNAPKEAASLIAESLVYFDDPDAQRAVDEYVPKDTAKVYRDARAAGKTPFR